VKGGFKRLLYDVSVHGFLRPLAKPVHGGLVRVTLWIERLFDTFASSPEEQDLIGENLTAVVKTFERPAILERLIRSLRRRYPSMRVVVVDDSRSPRQLPDVETITMPYDSGVSAGRNEALKHVKTPYLLLLDDDFVFYRHTRLQPVLETLERQPKIDIVGGEVLYLPFYRKIDYSGGGLHPTTAKSVLPAGSEIGGLTVHDKVANFYVARTESIRKVGWDPAIKRIDHADFFTRAKGVLVTVFDPAFKILHARTPFDRAYLKKRYDLDRDREVLRRKYYRNL